ncbi:hypothetical protein [Streptomyces sp. A 4/2]|uniref:hypothetical protein n=1 Tax=Streptomyces sp. A 4/2 TaxID=2934314 RepID=UPI002024ABCA|nr:hypothetical protein [Streptomyces sp. A 4/2]
MTADEQQLCAVRVRARDLVLVRGLWCEVTSLRLDRYPTGGAAVVLAFTARSPLRVPAHRLVRVVRR